MASIKCKACGRQYAYRSSELCPKCGAYNRPPHRMRVGFNADGGVELQSEREFSRNARAAGPDDVCYEEQARKVRSSEPLIDSKTLDALGDQLNKWGSRVEKWWSEQSEKSRPAANNSPLRDRKKGKGSKGGAIIAALAVIVSLLGIVLDSCGSNRVAVPAPDVSISTEQALPSEVYWSEELYQKILETYAVTEEVAMGTVFEWRGTKLWLGGWEITGGSGDNFMVVSVNSSDAFPVEHLDDCFLLWVDWDGTEWVFNPTAFRNGALIFNYLHTDTMPENTLCWLMFNDFDENGNWSKTTAVSLVEHDVYFSDATQDFVAEEALYDDVWSEEGRKELLERYGVTEVYGMGSGFMWQWQNVGLSGWTINDNDGDSFMEVSIEADRELVVDLLSQCYLLWVDDSGNEWIYHPVAYRDGVLVFSDLHTSFIDDDTALWLLCEQYETGEDYHQYLWTTAVELN